MIHQADVAHGRDVVARWCAFAEQRLEYLTELFETGRWRRFHSELGFLENIQEAKTAVEVWRGLATRASSPNQCSAHVSWHSRAETERPRADRLRNPVHLFSRPPVAIPIESLPDDGSIVGQADPVLSDEAPASHTPVMDHASELILDIDAIEQRYPLLRNALG